jgi:hypothetical protein
MQQQHNFGARCGTLRGPLTVRSVGSRFVGIQAASGFPASPAKNASPIPQVRPPPLPHLRMLRQIRLVELPKLRRARMPVRRRRRNPNPTPIQSLERPDRPQLRELTTPRPRPTPRQTMQRRERFRRHLSVNLPVFDTIAAVLSLVLGHFSPDSRQTAGVAWGRLICTIPPGEPPGDVAGSRFGRSTLPPGEAAGCRDGIRGVAP